ncbi:MAG: tRNA 2-thiocytidine biosynthesis protein TtcA [Bacilli bacterium]|nr:tRNA 2-thiocytidine biosynthesis protein TtcA [Bacilli bacterium]
MENCLEIERSIITKFRKQIWAKFIKAIKDFELIQDGDKIAVCISGGKDSMLLAKCMQELLRHRKINFGLKFIVMNPGYSNETIDKINENLKILNIDACIFETDIFKFADTTKSPCYMCAKMRRGSLYSKAKELGCNKIALGHHFDDVVETVLLNMIYNGEFSSMMPKLHSDNFSGLELIRPLYLIEEKDIIGWSKYNNLTFIDCACSVTKKSVGKRREIKKLISDLKEIYPAAHKCILSSTSNVNLNTVLGYKKNKEKFNFLDEYYR